MATPTVAVSTNTNIEKIGSIKVLSSTSATANEKSGLIFGGYGYSSDVQANNGEGYSISIKVISKNGKYDISSADLNVTSKGSKNIIVGNFTFYDFYLVSYSIDKEVENSILTLTYKDKSIFMDKVFIGLFNYHYGNAFDAKGQFFQNEGILNGETTVATFKYKCNDSPTGIKNAFLRRYPNRVQTVQAAQIIYNKNALELSKFATKPDFLTSDAFFCQYNYKDFGVNGGYIILGREELNEENCSLPEVSYCFKDLTSALAYADIPGIINFNLGKDNEIYRILRRNYFGSLRNVLDQWGGDFGFKFYYQPKIDFKVKDYSNSNSTPVLKTISEGIKLINLTSTSTTLKNLNSLFDSTSSKYDASLQKVVESLSSNATLEGTRKTNVITPIRRDARTFNSESSSINYKTTTALPLGYLPSFNLNDPAGKETIIGGTLSIYDPQLRDLYHLNNKNYKALGIVGTYIDLTVDSGDYSPFIGSSLDFLQTFGTTPTSSPSDILSDYIILLAIYSEDRHSLIKDWEKSVMADYYNQYYMVANQGETSSCNNFSNFSISYSTVPPSQSYIANQLPFVKLLAGQYGNDEMDFKFGSKKYNPIFKAENPFGPNNDDNYKNFAAGIQDYESYKTLTIINFKNDPKAGMAFLSCLNANGYNSMFNFVNNNNVSLILARKIKSSSSKISSIDFASGSFTNSAVVVAGTLASKDVNNAKNCPKTVCEQTLAESICGDANSSAQVNETNTGFMSNLAKKIIITSSISTSCELILPVDSAYKYAETKSTNSTVTLSAATYVLGTPPFYESDKLDNVMSYEIIDNTVPEILTQSTTSTGVIDQIVTFDDTGKNSRVLSAKDYHDRVNKNLNNSVPDAFEQKKISLTSTYIPTSMVDYIFTNPILNSMNFSFNESGFNTVLDFSSRPKQPKQKDSLFLTQRFLRKL